MAAGFHFRGSLGIAPQNVAHLFGQAGHLGEHVVKELQREHLLSEQGFDLGFGDGGNIVKVLLSQFLDLRSLDHAPIPHEGHALAPKALDHFADLGAEGFGVSGVTGENFDGQGPPLLVAEQADDDLFFARLAVAVVTPGRQRVVVAFQIAAGDVIKEKVRAAVGVKVLEEPLFNVDLVVRQPGQVGVKLIFVKRAEVQNVTGGMGAR